MSARTSGILLAVLSFTLLAQPVIAQQKMTDKELAERVRKAIDKGVAYLKASQGRNGSWDHHGLGLDRWDAGLSCLAMLALLECGVDPTDDGSRTACIPSTLLPKTAGGSDDDCLAAGFAVEATCDDATLFCVRIRQMGQDCIVAAR